MYLALQPEAPSLQRIDRIVAELNVRNRTMEIKVVQGEAAAESSVAPPALERSENVYQIPLWQALIRSGSTVTLTDERSITFTPTEVAAQFRELQAEFEKIKAGETTVYAVYA